MRDWLASRTTLYEQSDTMPFAEVTLSSDGLLFRRVSPRTVHRIGLTTMAPVGLSESGMGPYCENLRGLDSRIAKQV